MNWYVIDKENAKFFEKEDGNRVWNLTKKQAMELSEFAVVVSLDERNFNESLNAYLNGKLFEQVHYDKHLGWVC